MLIIWSIISIVAVWSYLALIVFILKNWQLQQAFNPSINRTKFSDISLSILIASRNEGNRLIQCLESLQACGSIVAEVSQIIIVDDFSDDNSFTLLDKLNLPQIRIVSMHDYVEDSALSSKKTALARGLSYASSDYILQLDADVVVEASYLQAIFNYLSKHKPDFIAAPVKLTGNNTIFSDFQIIDFMGIMGVTQAGINSGYWYMANGANMIYRRDVVQFRNDGLASGDDVFAIQQAVRKGKKISFLKCENSIVSTAVTSDLKSFYSQRIRWATKNKYMSSLKMHMMMVIPFINAVVFFCLLFGFFIFDKTIFSLLLVHHLFISITLNFIYLKELSQFFRQKIRPGHFLVSQFLHYGYILTIGSLSLFVSNYKWKGRLLK